MSEPLNAEKVVPATGNDMKSHDAGDTFLEVSYGGGNLSGVDEVHLLIRSNDGEFAQGWFRTDDLLAALVQKGAGDDA